jgi:hypothetical protein
VPTTTNATVTLKKLTEKRELDLVKDDFAGWDNGIELRLHVDGPDVQGARKYGKLKAIQAVDDAGTDLTKQGEGPKFMDSDSYHEIREEPNWGRQDNSKPKPTGFDVDLKLPTPAARSAKSIKVVAGNLVVLVGGEKKVIEIKPIKSHIGEPIDDPALKALGVSFTLIDPSARSMKQKIGGAIIGSSVGGKRDRSVSAEIVGNIDAIAQVTIVDPSGKKLSGSSMWSDEPNPAGGGGGKRSITYNVDKPLPADATMQIEVYPGQKTVPVVFELKDIKLP